MTIRIDPVPGARLRFLAKRAGEDAFDPGRLRGPLRPRSETVPEPTSACWPMPSRAAPTSLSAYVGIEEEWRIVQPLLDDPAAVEPYEPGTWGPPGPRKLTRGVCRWLDPWLPATAGGWHAG